MGFITKQLAASVAMVMVNGAAVAETKTYPLTGFDAVRASAGVDVTVIVGDAYAVVLETDGDPDFALAKREGDSLVLGRTYQSGTRISMGRGARYSFSVSMPQINEAASASGAKITITGIDGDEVSLSSSSGADLTAAGQCARLKIEASSGSDIEAGALACDEVEAKASSGATIDVTARTGLKADASSGGHVNVAGDPAKRRVDRSSGGSVRFIDN